MTEAPSSLPPGTRDLSLSMAQVNLMAIPAAVIPVAVMLGLFVLANGVGAFRDAAAFMESPWVFAGILLGGILLHELLHGAAWAHYGRKSLRVITFGVHWKTLTPYAHCREPITVEAYRIGAAVPAIVLGIIPGILAIFGGMPVLLFPAIIFTAAAAGDFLILWMLRRERAGAEVLDHPDRAGCLVIDPPVQDTAA